MLPEWCCPRCTCTLFGTTQDTTWKQEHVHPELSDDDYAEVVDAFGECEIIKEGRNGYSRHLLFSKGKLVKTSIVLSDT